jgi:copper homeostasis protein
VKEDPSRKYIIEIATSDYSTTKSAVEGGADRIELCANLAEGGTTASFGLLKQCREAFTLPIFPIIRPRGGDFLYTDEEFSVMLNDTRICKSLGFEGIVTGMLVSNGNIDIHRLNIIIEHAYPMEVTFHRAFDRCREPIEALEQLINAGCQRILTSGQKPSVSEGMELIAELNRVAEGRIIIMPGSGVRKENIKELAEATGCMEFHSSLRSSTNSLMEYRSPSFKDSKESYSNNHIDPQQVRALRAALPANN